MINFTESIYKSLKFLVLQEFFSLKAVNVSEKKLKIKGTTISLDFYTPGKENQKNHKTILINHGMVPLGNRDLRMIHFSKSLAGCGYNVVVPFYKEIAALKIRSKDIDFFADVILKVNDDKTLCPLEKIAIFSISFSGGMSLIASSKIETAAKISSICALGSYCNVESAFEYVLKNQNIDSYGRNVIFFNFLHLAFGGNGKNNRLQKAFKVAALDNVLKPKSPELPQYLRSLSKKDQSLYNDLDKQSKKRLGYYKKFRPKIEKILQSFYVLDKLEKIQASVTLLHGSFDNVIPPKESVILHKKLEGMKISNTLFVSPVISHAEGKLSLKMIPDIIRLVKAFAFFFRKI